MSAKETGQPDVADIWDDQLLVRAYNSSVNLAQEELAKRISMRTNTQPPLPQAQQNEEKEQQDEETANDENNSAAIVPPWTKWQVGDFVRATYDDGIDYEAEIIRINKNNNKFCRIRYYGYGNEHEVLLNDLLPSWGKKAREEQLYNAQCDANPVDVGEIDDVTDSNEEKQGGDEELPSSTKPGVSKQSARPPKPPMPPMFVNIPGVSSEENDYIQSLIMSWYISGYYTGLYQGLRTEKSKKKK